VFANTNQFFVPGIGAGMAVPQSFPGMMSLLIIQPPRMYHIETITDPPVLIHHLSATQWGVVVVNGDMRKPDIVNGVHILA